MVDCYSDGANLLSILLAVLNTLSCTVRQDPGSNLTAAGRVYHDSRYDIQPWARVVHPYCSA